ncbi:MAG TPA: DUF4381 domain-containing protein [Gammaproteobacteria bacterium]|nr:DUF4381 domain-containing protein [Gammaproteobacteria bacterium]
MEDLIDIQGLDQISWWPLAFGWWVVLGLVIVGVVVASFFLWRSLKYKRSWQYKAFKRLAKMQSQLGQSEPKQILQNLSLELRKIAMLTTQRETCAGLIGDQWLQWLQQHDPAGFDWAQNGRLITALQYMPATEINDPAQINELICAAQGWVKKC